MAFFRLTRKASIDNARFLTGSSTAPRVKDMDFSGCRFGFPPVMVGNWLLQSVGRPVLVSGQRSTSRVPLAVTLDAWAAYKSVSDGARKPVPAEPRSSTDSAGCQRSEALGLTVSPTPW